MALRLAVVGATGLVGRTMIRVLEERHFAFDELRLFASARSASQHITAFGRDFVVEELNDHSFDHVDLALFSAGGTTSLRYAPVAAAAGCVVVDNSSAWRMHSAVPLVVPEVNADALSAHHGIIANPNCSTIQMVVALKAIHDAFGLRRVVVSTYQSPSGAGQKGVDQLTAEVHDRVPTQRISVHPVAYNTVFHSINSQFAASEEEIKMKQETRRILSLPQLPIAVTCVRVPVLGGHGESLTIECERNLSAQAVYDILARTPGIVMLDDPAHGIYPTTQVAKDHDEVFVGRIREDDSISNGIQLWVVADNLRKGAATNAVQIAERLVADGYLSFETFAFS